MIQMYHFAVITENFPPCAGGGIAEWAYGVADHLNRLGHRVTVLSRWKEKADANSHQDQDFQVRRMGGHDWHRYRYWYSLYYLRWFLRRHANGIVLATTWELARPMVFLRRFYPSSGLVVVSHGLDVTKIQSTRTMERFRKTGDVSDLVVSVSRFTREAVRDRLGNSRKDHVIFIPNGVDTNRFHRVDHVQGLKRHLGIAPDAKIILTLARVIERKGHDTVIRCLPDVLEEFPNCVYVIAGPWRESWYGRLRTLIQQLHLSRHVIFTGMVDDQELNLYYSMSDVYIMVSRTLKDQGDVEGFGISFLEANACGCPVIGSISGGIPDAVEDGINGFLVPPEDTRLLASKIRLLLRDTELNRRMGETGRRRVEDAFTWEKITGRLYQEFQGRYENRVRE